MPRLTRTGRRMPSELVEEKRRARVRRSLFPKVLTLTHNDKKVTVLESKVPPFHVFLPTWISYDTPACAGLRSAHIDGA